MASFLVFYFLSPQTVRPFFDSMKLPVRSSDRYLILVLSTGNSPPISLYLPIMIGFVRSLAGDDKAADPCEYELSKFRDKYGRIYSREGN